MIWYALWILFKAVRNLAGHKSFIFLLSVSTSLQSSTTTIVMPKTPSVTRSRTAAAMKRRRRDDQPSTSTDDSSATSSASSSRGRGRGRGRGKRGRASNKKDFSQQTLACKGCGQIGHTVLLCEEEVTSNELALTTLLRRVWLPTRFSVPITSTDWQSPLQLILRYSAKQSS